MDPEEARQVLAESPWVKTVTPTPNESGKPGRTRGGAGPDGVRVGRVRPRSARYGTPRRPERRGPSAGRRRKPEFGRTADFDAAVDQRAAHKLGSADRARTECARSRRKPRPAIAVYGLPSGFLRGDPDSLGAGLRSRAALKRDKKKDMAPSSVEVLLRDEGPVVVYFFPRSNEITRKDKQVEFDAEIGRLKFAEFRPRRNGLPGQAGTLTGDRTDGRLRAQPRNPCQTRSSAA